MINGVSSVGSFSDNDNSKDIFVECSKLIKHFQTHDCTFKL